MKIFEKDDGWRDKVNFVDENNVLVGYDLDESCCEWADWFISPKRESDLSARWGKKKKETPDVSGYVFDKDFFEEVEDADYSKFSDGGMVRFRLVSGKKELFLHLFNVQNGYYSHGFEVRVEGKKIRENYL